MVPHSSVSQRARRSGSAGRGRRGGAPGEGLDQGRGVGGRGAERPVGVEQQGAARFQDRGGDLDREGVDDLRESQRRPGGHIEDGRLPAGPVDDRCEVARAGHLAHPGRGVVHDHDAGGVHRLVRQGPREADRDVPDAGEQLVERQVERGDGEHGVPDDAHRDGLLQAVVGDVACDGQGAPAGQRHRVVPVAADVLACGGTPAGRGLHRDQVGQFARQQFLLQPLGALLGLLVRRRVAHGLRQHHPDGAQERSVVRVEGALCGPADDARAQVPSAA